MIFFFFQIKQNFFSSQKKIIIQIYFHRPLNFELVFKAKHTQESVLEHEIFKIPIEQFEHDIEKVKMEENKKKIYELLTGSNYLRTKNEFDQIEFDLHRACRECDFDLIRILLSETIEDESKSLKLKINKTNHTASLFKITNNNIDELILSRTIKH